MVQDLDKTNCSELLRDKNRTYSIIKLLMPKLKPSEVRIQVERAFIFQEEDQKGSLNHFETMIAKLAVEVK